ncbi:hypothetical protein ACS5PN_00570 [Roseateles sp. NT4]|uniref:hypothetical protein n=1 Tax=Roseateles sp. NT4 TaxID=3453715 RepID=UPI003EE99116
MQISFHAFAQDSVHQIRATLRRVRGLHETSLSAIEPSGFWTAIELPKPDVVAWQDTEIDVRRVVL